MANRTISEAYRRTPAVYRSLSEVPALMTITEAAKLMRCCEKTIRTMIANGEVAAIRRPKQTLIAKESILNMITKG